MPGHDTSSFVSRDRGLAEVIDGRIFCVAERFRRMPGNWPSHFRVAVPLPDTTLTEVRSPRKSAVLRPPGKTTPVRRLTVNRKPLRTHGSLAQPPASGNGLYSTAGHLVESDRLPYSRRAARQEPRSLPCLTAGTASSRSPPIPSNTRRHSSAAWPSTPPWTSRSPIARFAARKPGTIRNLAPTFNGTYPFSMAMPGSTCLIAAPARTLSSVSSIRGCGSLSAAATTMRLFHTLVMFVPAFGLLLPRPNFPGRLSFLARTPFL